MFFFFYLDTITYSIRSGVADLCFRGLPLVTRRRADSFSWIGEFCYSHILWVVQNYFQKVSASFWKPRGWTGKQTSYSIINIDYSTCVFSSSFAFQVFYSPCISSNRERHSAEWYHSPWDQQVRENRWISSTQFCIYTGLLEKFEPPHLWRSTLSSYSRVTISTYVSTVQRGFTGLTSSTESCFSTPGSTFFKTIPSLSSVI